MDKKFIQKRKVAYLWILLIHLSSNVFAKQAEDSSNVKLSQESQLLGTDLNKNFIRDDVDLFLKEYSFKEPKLFKAFTFYAQFTTRGLIANSIDDINRFQDKKGDVGLCIGHFHKEKVEFSLAVLDKITRLIVNTKLRKEKFESNITKFRSGPINSNGKSVEYLCN